MLYMFKDRKGNLDYDKEGKLVNFLYGSVIGRCLIKFLSCLLYTSDAADEL